MTNLTAYPVIEERPLDPATRGWLGRSRDLTQLPRHLPGTVPVFEVQDGYVAFQERRHLGRREDLVVNAISVSIVDVRPRTVTVQLQVPSRSAADDFVLLVDFRCQVQEAETVAAFGTKDMTEPLRQYLRRDVSLTELGVGYSVEDINEVRKALASRVDAYTRLRAPHVDGMSISLGGVRVVTPKDLANHERDKRNVRWGQDKAELEYAGEDRNAARLRRYVKGGPDELATLALARGELNLEDAVNRGHQTTEEKRKQLIELLQTMSEEERHMIAVDSQRIVDTLVNDLLDSPARTNQPGVTSGDERDQLEA
jgi:hypothetical protein